MKEFMLLIRNEADSKTAFSGEQENEFLEACRVYIEKLQKNGNLKTAQPLIREGKMLSCPNGTWTEGPYREHKEVIVGYYHILAKDLDEAVELAKGNPEFEYTSTARIEVRPVKMNEETTAYVYPNS
ncbi:MAG: YciI family protein [Sphingobacteriales bacterium]